MNFNFYETPPKGKNYEIVFLCVKPNNLVDIAPWFHGITGSQSTVVSILAGKTLSDIQQELSLDCNIARAMPNINAISIPKRYRTIPTDIPVTLLVKTLVESYA